MIPFRSLSDFIFDGFILFTILISLGYLFVTKYRQTIIELNVLSAKFLLIGAGICLILEIKQLLNYWAHTYTYEQTAFGVGLFRSGWFTYYLALLFNGIVPQILWIKKLRHKLWISLALIPFLLIENFWGLFVWNNSDYIRSSYIMYFDYSGLLISCIMYALLITICYAVIRSKPRTNTKNAFFIHLLLLIVMLPIAYLLNNNILPFNIIPGWHINIYPIPYIIDIFRFLILLIVVIIYYKLSRDKIIIPNKIFYFHLPFSLLTVLPTKYIIILILQLRALNGVSTQDFQTTYYLVAFINIIFFLSQLAFIIYLYKIKNRLPS